MATTITIHMKSGAVAAHPLDESAFALSADDACDSFWKAVEISKLEVLKLHGSIYFVREIERLVFA